VELLHPASVRQRSRFGKGGAFFINPDAHDVQDKKILNILPRHVQSTLKIAAALFFSACE